MTLAKRIREIGATTSSTTVQTRLNAIADDLESPPARKPNAVPGKPTCPRGHADGITLEDFAGYWCRVCGSLHFDDLEDWYQSNGDYTEAVGSAKPAPPPAPVEVDAEALEGMARSLIGDSTKPGFATLSTIANGISELGAALAAEKDTIDQAELILAEGEGALPLLAECRRLVTTFADARRERSVMKLEAAEGRTELDRRKARIAEVKSERDRLRDALVEIRDRGCIYSHEHEPCWKLRPTGTRSIWCGPCLARAALRQDGGGDKPHTERPCPTCSTEDDPELLL